jgi:hypothetical protein
MNSKEELFDKSVKDREMMMQNENYRRFAEEREKIKSKYDKSIFSDTGVVKTKSHTKWFGEEGRWEYRKYLNEILDVMLRLDSDFSKFLVDVEPEVDKQKYNKNYKNSLK